jgi:hypothetical protein
MIDHQPTDLPLAQARTQIAIAAQGEHHAASDKLPADRAIAEALTMNAISHNPQEKLKTTGRRTSQEDGLTDEQKAALLQDAQAEKDRKAAAKVYGGGDAKAGMAAIRGEIENQGVISVPHDKLPDDHISLNQIKTMAQINALSEGKRPDLAHSSKPIVDHGLTEALTMKALSSDVAKSHLTHADTHGDVTMEHAKTMYAIDHLGEPHLKHDEHTLTDATLAHEKTLYAIGHHQAQSVPAEKASFADKALLEALTMNALSSEAPKNRLAHVESPSDGLTAEDLASLQAAAAQEKAADAEPTTPVIHMPKDE